MNLILIVYLDFDRTAPSPVMCTIFTEVREKFAISMAEEHAELMNECCPQHLGKGVQE